MTTGAILQGAITALNQGAWEQADRLCRSVPAGNELFPDAVYLRGLYVRLAMDAGAE